MNDQSRAERLRELLADPDTEIRLKATMAAGTHPHPTQVEVLIEQCRGESDFFVRDTLTWALLMHPRDLVVPHLAKELWRAEDQARSQALHTLSKIADPDTWPLITDDMLHDRDDSVARTAWRAASVLVPDKQRQVLAEKLIRELGRGDLHLQRSLSRSLAALGESALPALEHADRTGDEPVRAHVEVTRRLIADPDLDFEVAVEVAKSVVATGDRLVHRVKDD